MIVLACVGPTSHHQTDLSGQVAGGAPRCGGGCLNLGVAAGEAPGGGGVAVAAGEAPGGGGVAVAAGEAPGDGGVGVAAGEAPGCGGGVPAAARMRSASTCCERCLGLWHLLVSAFLR